MLAMLLNLFVFNIWALICSYLLFKCIHIHSFPKLFKMHMAYVFQIKRLWLISDANLSERLH